MKAISLWEPWASLIRCGAKTWETRSRSTKYRGELLICAAKSGLNKERMNQLLDTPHVQHGLMPLVSHLKGNLRVGFWNLNFGNAVAIVELTQCVPTENLMSHEIGEDIVFGDFSYGRYAWKLENLKVIEPFPVKGSQGFFEVQLPTDRASLGE